MLLLPWALPIHLQPISCLGLNGYRMGVKSFLEKCAMIASMSSLIRLTQWKTNWSSWRTRLSSSYRLDGAVSSCICGPVCIMGTSPPIVTAMVKGGEKASFEHRSPQESHLVESSLLPLENLQFSFETRALFSGSLLLTHALLRGFLCPLLQVFLLLKPVVCTHFHGFSDMHQLSIWMWTSAFMGCCVPWPQHWGAGGRQAGG